MRGNFGATGGGGAEVQVDNDTSSSGSSPHSNQDEDIIEVRRGPKPIYNFSIPDVIDHEQRKRKRGYPSRGAYRGSATSKSRKLRKNNEHHVIDLTEDSHDEEDADQQTNNRSWDSELNIGDESFIEALSGIEQFRHRLSQSRERMQHIIRPNYLFRRSLVTDGPTEEVIRRNESRRLHHRDPPTSLDESVVVLDDLLQNDREIALQMANDPTFSPPSTGIPISRESLRRSTMEQHQRLDANLQRRIHDNRQRLQQLRSDYLRFSPHLTEEERRLRHAQGANDPEMNSPTDVEIIREMPPTSFNEFIQNFTEETLFPVRVNTRSIFPERFPVSSGLMSNFLETPPRLSHFQDFEALWDLTERIGPAKPRGLSKTEVDSIPSFRFSSGTAKETNKKCVVCLSEYANREKLRRLPCSHDFHSKCIDKWLKSSRTCPVCRDDVQKADALADQTTSPLEE